MKCLRFSEVGQFKILIRSSYSISPRFCPSPRRDAPLWTFSSTCMSFTNYGHHTGATYSRIGLTTVMYRIENTSWFVDSSVLLTMPEILIALFTAALTWAPPRQFIGNQNSEVFHTLYWFDCDSHSIRRGRLVTVMGNAHCFDFSG